MYYVVTGAAGFIGSKQGDKFRNLANCDITDYLDQAELLEALEGLSGSVEAVLHQGACSDTTMTDGRYVMDTNYRYSKQMLEWCQDEEIPLLYASSAAT